ncbi:hypothetical protein [Agromyces marinus]|nr:hypothetical protein [Agromyces marinus]
MTAPEAAGRARGTEDPVARIVAQEVASLREGFGRGAEFAVTRSTARERMLHRLECASIASHLDPSSRWTTPHRRRLDADPSYRIPMPVLVTRQAARELTGVRSCRVCWPNVSGEEPRPLRHVSAQRLGPQHVGRVLARPDGEPLGTIVRWRARIGADLFGVEHDEIEITTSAGVVTVARDGRVTIWDLPTDEEAIRRKTELVHRFASGDPRPA